MNMYIILSILVVIVVVVIILSLKKSGKQTGLPYERKGQLFTNAEQGFLHVLKETVGAQYEVFGQIRVADVLAVKKGLDKSANQSAFNRIKAKHVDFVLCKPTDYSVVAAIELDDTSHEQANRREREAFLDQAFEVAGVPLIRFKVQQAYKTNEIARSLKSSIDFKIPIEKAEAPVRKQPLSKSKTVEPLEDPMESTIILNIPGHEEKVNNVPEEKLCPKCALKMIRKKATKGTIAGKIFWVCSNYSECKTFEPIA